MDFDCLYFTEMPGFWLLKLFGLTWHFKDLLLNRILALIRGLIILAFLTSIFVWLIFFAVSVLAEQITNYQNEVTEGLVKSSSIIVLVLDEIPWIVIILRNLLILAVFFSQHQRLPTLYTHLKHLQLETKSWLGLMPMRRVINLSVVLFSVSVLTLAMCSVLVLFYWNKLDLSSIDGPWTFDPIPAAVTNIQAMTLMWLFGSLPFIFAQAIMSSVVGLAEGGRLLLENLNASMEEIAVRKGHHGGKKHTVYRTNLYELAELPPKKPLQIAELRQMHYKINQYILDISEQFSKIFFCALACDFVIAVGFVGLLIGYSPEVDVDETFARCYHATATVLWMGFYLVGQYWPLVLLNEEAEKTYYIGQALSFVPEVTPDEDAERELAVLLFATKHADIGVVAGRLFMFSRHLCVTIVTLLFSYAVIVYEILHRDAGGSHGESATSANKEHALMKLETALAANISFKSH